MNVNKGNLEAFAKHLMPLFAVLNCSRCYVNVYIDSNLV